MDIGADIEVWWVKLPPTSVSHLCTGSVPAALLPIQLSFLANGPGKVFGFLPAKWDNWMKLLVPAQPSPVYCGHLGSETAETEDGRSCSAPLSSPLFVTLTSK